MASVTQIKQQVREFYNQIGWQPIGEGLYQNATYEDLRPVSRQYIHRCHLRVARHLKPQGKYLLDAGSGPIQYPEYLEYSRGYQYRVCADISLVALQEARKRIGAHGLFVVADVANLPFKDGAFDGVVSLHTLHHLPLEEQPHAYRELYRLLVPSASAVVVNGWHMPPLTRLANRLIRLVERLRNRKPQADEAQAATDADDTAAGVGNAQPSATFVSKANAAWLERTVGSQIPLEIYVWRTFGVKVLRTFVHDGWGGRLWLRLLYWLEERFPHWLGKNGQYPLIVIRKSR